MSSVIYLIDTRLGGRAWNHPSARHRCYHFSDALLGAGTDSCVMPLERVSVKLLERYEHAIFHRPSYSKRFENAFSACRKASVTVHADYDDLVFQSDFAQFSPLYVTGSRSLEKVTQQFENNNRAAQYFGSFIVSTRFLRDKLVNVFADAVCSVVPNALPRLFSRPKSLANNNLPLTIGYFPGSHGHGEDFSSIKSAVCKVVNSSRGKIRLLVAGKLDQQYLDGIDHVITMPFAGYSRYLVTLASVDVSIAPLANNLFNDAKSAVKLIESVSVATPIVATGNGDMKDHNNPLSNLPDGCEDWRDALSESLILARESREKNKAIADDLAQQFSTCSRLPLLQAHLQCAA